MIRAERNLGFAAAANIGVRATAAPYVLLLNPDARLTPGCLAPLMDDLERHPECAVVAPLVVNEDGTPQGNARGDPTMMTGLFGRTSLMRRLVPRSCGYTQRRSRMPPAFSLRLTVGGARCLRGGRHSRTWS
jgi:GT2 family glycosyltransferase